MMLIAPGLHIDQGQMRFASVNPFFGSIADRGSISFCRPDRIA
jgi:hypothetical protein